MPVIQDIAARTDTWRTKLRMWAGLAALTGTCVFLFGSVALTILAASEPLELVFRPAVHALLLVAVLFPTAGVAIGVRRWQSQYMGSWTLSRDGITFAPRKGHSFVLYWEDLESVSFGRSCVVFVAGDRRMLLPWFIFGAAAAEARGYVLDRIRGQFRGRLHTDAGWCWACTFVATYLATIMVAYASVWYLAWSLRTRVALLLGVSFFALGLGILKVVRNRDRGGRWLERSNVNETRAGTEE